MSLDNNEQLMSQLKILKEKITSLELKMEEQDKSMKEEVAKAIFHHIQSIQHRMDQFIFDAKMLQDGKLDQSSVDEHTDR